MEKENSFRKVARGVMGITYAIAGAFHLAAPASFLKITPAWVPWPETVVAFTGVCEIAGAIALLFISRLRRAAGWAFAAYAVCVFPANLNHAFNHIAIGGSALGWWYHGPRLLLQPVIVWWALWGTGIIDWPFRGRNTRDPAYAPDQRR